MPYNLQEFGKQIRDMRNNLRLTQRKITELSGISEDTLRKIENGKVAPTQETLDLLSLVLKTDLNRLFLNARVSNFNEFNDLKCRIESKLDNDDYQSLLTDLAELKSIKTSTHPYFSMIISQYTYLIESIVLNKDNNKAEESLNYLVRAITLTTPQFSLDNYKEFVYSSMELRILMSIALRVNKIGSPEKSLEILEFCLKNVDPTDKLYPKICYNLSFQYHRLDLYENALETSILGIDFCYRHRDYAGLNLLFFRKGVAEYLLGYNNYVDSLKKSIYFCEALGQDKLKEIIVKNCKEVYKIDLL